MAIIAFAILLCVAAGLAAYVNRPNKTSIKGKAKSPKGDSVLVSLWNGTGARELKAKTTGGAVAELVGRATGSTARGVGRATRWTGRKTGAAARWTGRKAADKADSRWTDRRAEPGKPPVWKADRADQAAAETSDPGSANDPTPATSEPAQPIPAAPAAPDPSAPAAAPKASSNGHAEGRHMATYKNLFESGQAIAQQPITGIFNFQHLNRSIRDGTQQTSRMYVALAERLAGPMNLDPIVTNPIRECAGPQQAIAGLIGDADSHLTRMLSTSVNQTLEQRNTVIREHWLDNGGAHTSRVPEFFQTVTTLAGRQHEDIRDVHCQIKALAAASEQQAIMYRQIAARLRDKNMPALAERYDAASGHQNVITEKLTQADGNLHVILTMALRELAASNLKAPNAHLLNA